MPILLHGGDRVKGKLGAWTAFAIPCPLLAMTPLGKNVLGEGFPALRPVDESVVVLLTKS